MKETVFICVFIGILIVMLVCVVLRFPIRLVVLFNGEWKIKLQYLFFSKKLCPTKRKVKRSTQKEQLSNDRIFPASTLQKLRDIPKTISSFSAFFEKHFPSLTLRVRSLYLVIGLSDAAFTAGLCTAAFTVGNLIFSILDEFLPHFIVDNSAVFPDYTKKRFDYELCFIISVSAFDTLRFLFHALTSSLQVHSADKREAERSIA